MKPIKEKLRAHQDGVLVQDMDFGERVTEAGVVILKDDGKNVGIRPRWGKVYSKGPLNTEEYNVGDWVYVKHGRWSRGFEVELEDGRVTELRVVELESVMLWSDVEPVNDSIGVM
jgi:hypothetical protein|tara:strand:- start:1899 stop:2243 length:345 start_codon:yes stop_codon:yes gene_type:complete